MDWRDNLQVHLQKLEGKVEEAAHQLREININSIHITVMKEYKLSQACFPRKEEYAMGFIKYEVYLAWGYLENMHPNESYPELVYIERVLNCVIPN